MKHIGQQLCPFGQMIEGECGHRPILILIYYNYFSDSHNYYDLFLKQLY